MKHTPLPALLLLMFCVGCSDPLLEEPTAAPSPQAPVAIAVDAIEPVAPIAQPAPGMAAPSIPTTPTNPLPEAVATEQTLHTLNMFLIEYQANGGRIPATVEEMVMQKILPKVPPAPSGKRFEVDQEKAMISFADI